MNKIRQQAKSYAFDNDGFGYDLNTCEDIFTDGAEWMEEQMIEKFCKWFKREYEDIGIRYIRGYEAEDYFDDIKQAMEG